MNLVFVYILSICYFIDCLPTNQIESSLDIVILLMNVLRVALMLLLVAAAFGLRYFPLYSRLVACP